VKIVKRKLTLVQNTAAHTVKCTAGCQVELNPLEAASLLNPLHPGFRLRCVLIGIDPGTDPVIFTYAKSKNFKSITDLAGLNQVFEDDLSTDILNEDPNGTDEIRARFTLIDLSNGQSVTKTTNLVEMAL